MSRSVDFDAIKAETELGEPIEVTHGKKTFHVHPEMPWEFAVKWDNGLVEDALALLVPDDELESFRAMVFSDRPSRATALKRLQAIWDTGESKASSRSSTNGGTRSRPTSKPTTTST